MQYQCEGSQASLFKYLLNLWQCKIHVQLVMNNTHSQRVPSFLKMQDLYPLQFSEKRKQTTLSKTNKAVEVLLEHLKKRDVKIRDVNRTTVTDWLDKHENTIDHTKLRQRTGSNLGSGS